MGLKLGSELNILKHAAVAARHASPYIASSRSGLPYEKLNTLQQYDS